MADKTVRRIVDASLTKIDALNGDTRALIHINPAAARAQADELDRTGLQGGPLFGTTFVAKDMIDVAHQPTRGGSRLFGDQPASADASCVSRLKGAGAVVLGKSNMHELAAGGAVNPWFGQVVNPLSKSHGTGGTSSGSAAAVAAGFCSFSLGTDSGGSNRSVAAATGLYGYKPTNGLIAADGVLPTAPTMDTVGVISSSTELISACLQALTDTAASQEKAMLEGRTFARLTNLIRSPVDGSVSDALDLAFASVQDRGGRIVDLEIHAPEALARAGVAILRHEFANIYGDRIDQSADRVGQAVQAFLAASREISDHQYEEAMSLRAEHQAKWTIMFAQIDGFISPPAPGLAPDLDAEMTTVGSTRVVYGGAGAEFRMWANTIGIPVIAIPVRRTAGLPASIQLAGTMHSDRLLLDFAADLGLAMMRRIAA